MVSVTNYLCEILSSFLHSLVLNVLNYRVAKPFPSRHYLYQNNENYFKDEFYAITMENNFLSICLFVYEISTFS